MRVNRLGRTKDKTQEWREVLKWALDKFSTSNNMVCLTFTKSLIFSKDNPCHRLLIYVKFANWTLPAVELQKLVSRWQSVSTQQAYNEPLWLLGLVTCPRTATNTIQRQHKYNSNTAQIQYQSVSTQQAYNEPLWLLGLVACPRTTITSLVQSLRI